MPDYHDAGGVVPARTPRCAGEIHGSMPCLTLFNGIPRFSRRGALRDALAGMVELFIVYACVGLFLVSLVNIRRKWIV